MFRTHILNPGEMRTLRKRFKEPLYLVTKKLSDANYKIKFGEGVEKVVHYNNILKVSGEDRQVDPTFQQHFPPITSTQAVQASQAPRRSTRERNRPPRLDDYEVEAVGEKLS